MPDRRGSAVRLPGEDGPAFASPRHRTDGNRTTDAHPSASFGDGLRERQDVAFQSKVTGKPGVARYRGGPNESWVLWDDALVSRNDLPADDPGDTDDDPNVTLLDAEPGLGRSRWPFPIGATSIRGPA